MEEKKKMLSCRSTAVVAKQGLVERVLYERHKTRKIQHLLVAVGGKRSSRSSRFS